MRVAVHFPAGHELARGEATAEGLEAHTGPSVCAYRLGRIEDGVHNAPVGHDPVPLDEFVARLVRQAKEEYPDATVVVERLVQKRDDPDQGVWIPAEKFDPRKHTPVGAGRTINREISASVQGAAG